MAPKIQQKGVLRKNLIGEKIRRGGLAVTPPSAQRLITGLVRRENFQPSSSTLEEYLFWPSSRSGTHVLRRRLFFPLRRLMNEPQFLQFDVLTWARCYEGEPFHALLTDPPYHLTSIVNRFGKEGSAPAQHGKDGAFARASKGFMGKDWDGGDIAFRPETWAMLAKHLYPGAFLFAFAGSRGWHRQAVAMEDAGLIMHPTIFLYAFGSGFPKATRIADERFAGHRYGAQALKPAVEPILLFQKPYKGRPQDCITSTGAGTLNIDAGRIGTDVVRTEPGNLFPGVYGTFAECVESERQGRWPANLIIGDPEAVALLDQQSGMSRSGVRPPTGKPKFPIDGPSVKWNANSVMDTTFRGHEDAGGASRFFFTSNWNAEVAEGLLDADPLIYVAKAGRTERDKGLEDFNLQDPNSTFSAKPGRDRSNPNNALGGSRERVDKGEMPVLPRANNHPTVKSLNLCRHLATLLLPPAAYTPRRILVPFSGSGSEAIAAMLAGWEEIVGVEQSAEYVEIARNRAKFWSGNSGLFDQAEENAETPTQSTLFDTEGQS